MKKVSAIFLSLLLLASSTGIGYAQHFCGGKKMMAEITLGLKTLSCGMKMEDAASKNLAVVLEDHHCCENFVTKIKTDNNFAKASFDLKLNKTFVATVVSVFVLREVEIASTQKTFFADYSPPPLERDFNILYETFLI